MLSHHKTDLFVTFLPPCPSVTQYSSNAFITSGSSIYWKSSTGFYFGDFGGQRLSLLSRVHMQMIQTINTCRHEWINNRSNTRPSNWSVLIGDANCGCLPVLIVKISLLLVKEQTQRPPVGTATGPGPRFMCWSTFEGFMASIASRSPHVTQSGRGVCESPSSVI